MIKLLVMRVQAFRNILQDFPVCKLREGKTEELVGTEEFPLTRKAPFRILNPSKSSFLSISIIAFGVSNDDEMVTTFQRR
jgi:hypothetical protein